jgi:cytochrome d ubiquinol oxidase subunit I
MDALLLARLQFATTASFHFLFVILTLGLVTLVAVMQTRHTVRGTPELRRMTRFWGRLYVVNYALGIATGIVMEFQFGLDWTGLSAYAGDVFGAPLAIETLVAFFLEATFLGLWIFGWDRLNKWVHLALIWLVTLTAYASALFIMVANSFLQNPVGVREEGGVLKLQDFGALLSNPALQSSLPHVLGAALLTGGIFVSGVSAAHFLRHTDEVEFFRRSMRIGVVASLLGVVVTVNQGFAQFGLIAMYQPGKSGRPGVGVPLVIMIVIGFFFVLVTLVATILLYRNRITRSRFMLHLLSHAIPLPFIAVLCGWLYRELGRQPWLINGRLTTANAFAGIGAGQLLVSFIVFTALFAGLAIADWALLSRIAARGPETEQPQEEQPTLMLSGV